MRGDPQILFLNKNDLFEKKIQHSPIKNFFPVSLVQRLRYTRGQLTPPARISKVSQVTLEGDATTSSVGLPGWPRRPTRKNGRSTYSQRYFHRVVLVLIFSSITTATDTAMLRVVMAAVEGEFLYLVLRLVR